MMWSYLLARLDRATAGWFGRVVAVLFGGFVLLGLVVLLSACAAPAINPPLDLAERFRLVVFQDETRQSRRLYRWEDGPLRISVVGAEPWQRDMVREHAAVLGDVLGVEASVLATTSDEKSNMEILFDTPDKLHTSARAAVISSAARHIWP